MVERQRIESVVSEALAEATAKLENVRAQIIEEIRDSSDDTQRDLLEQHRSEIERIQRESDERIESIRTSSDDVQGDLLERHRNEIEKVQRRAEAQIKEMRDSADNARLDLVTRHRVEIEEIQRQMEEKLAAAVAAAERSVDGDVTGLHEQHRAAIEGLQQQSRQEINDAVAAAERQRERAFTEHREEIDRLRAAHATELERLTRAHATELHEKSVGPDDGVDLSAVHREHAAAVRDLQLNHAIEMEESRNEIERISAETEKQTRQLQRKLKQLDTQHANEMAALREQTAATGDTQGRLEIEIDEREAAIAAAVSAARSEHEVELREQETRAAETILRMRQEFDREMVGADDTTSALRARVKKLENLVETARAERDTARLAVPEGPHETERLLAEIEQLRSDLAKADAQQDHLRHVIAEGGEPATITELNARIRELENGANDAVRMATSQITEENASLRTELKRLSAELARERRKLDDASEEAETLEARVAQAEHDLKAFHEQFEKQNSDYIPSLQRELKRQGDRVEAMEPALKFYAHADYDQMATDHGSKARKALDLREHLANM